MNSFANAQAINCSPLTLIIGMIALLQSACDSKPNVQYKPASQEERACNKVVSDKIMKLAMDNLGKEFKVLHALTIEGSHKIIALTLEERRAMEQLCMEKAECSNNEKLMGIDFQDCLEGTDIPNEYPH